MWGSIHSTLWAQAVECLTEESSVVALSVSLTKLSDDTIRHHCHFSSLTLSLLFILSLMEIHISICFISSISNGRTCSPGSSGVLWDSGAMTTKYITQCLLRVSKSVQASELMKHIRWIKIFHITRTPWGYFKILCKHDVHKSFCFFLQQKLLVCLCR